MSFSLPLMQGVSQPVQSWNGPSIERAQSTCGLKPDRVTIKPMGQSPVSANTGK